jgi:phenylacetate-CoA ligase
MHSRDDFVIVEVNENNEIMLTPIESYGMPLLRYKLGDMGLIKKNNSKKSNSPFNEFNIVIGRVYETLYNKSGQKVNGGLIKEIIEAENLDINEFQLVQKTLDLAELNVVKDDLTTDKSVSRVVGIIKEVLGSKKVNVNYLKTYPVEPNGKRIAFKCEVKKR